jgi:hypothetical protein
MRNSLRIGRPQPENDQGCGTTLSTLATSSQQLQATITTAVISATGTASVKVNTPSGNSDDLGCTSGGTSSALEVGPAAVNRVESRFSIPAQPIENAV